MVAAAAMTNVVALNFCDDVPVKLYSTNILLMAVFLLVPGAQWRWTILALCQPL